MKKPATTLVLLFWMLISASHIFAQQDITEANLQATLKLEKVKAENQALRIMQKFKPKSQEHERAKVLYTEAENAYNAYTSTLLEQMRAGRKPDMTVFAQSAAAKAKTFSDYVEANAKSARSATLIPILATVLVEVAEKLWTYFSNRAANEREALARRLAPEVTWEKWAVLAAQG